MTCTAVEHRRDPRYNLRREVSFVEFDDPEHPETHWSGRLVSLSAAGINIELEERPEFEPGTLLRNVRLQIGNCRLGGSVAIKNVRKTGETELHLGGLFYPESEMESSRLMALIAGMEAVE